MGSGQSLEDEIFNLRFQAKQLTKESQKCKKAEKAERAKIKKAIEAGNMDIARIHSENAIRQKNQAVNFLKMGSRMEAITQRMQSAQAMKKLNKSMMNVSSVMKKAVDSMDIEKITKTMDQFEKNFEDLDIQSSVMESAIQQTTGQAMPEEQVDGLMREVADEHGLEIAGQLGDAPIKNLRADDQKVDDLERRFNELKANS